MAEPDGNNSEDWAISSQVIIVVYINLYSMITMQFID